MGFDALLGNDRLKQNLTRSLSKGHVSHFYLISGPEGSGKHTLAKLLGAAILCQGEDKPCGRCTPCRKVMDGSHPDFITVDDPEKKTVTVDLIRQARADVYIQPNESEYKIYMFPRAQDMGLPGQNALLKILEEPPKYGVFLLLTDNPDKLLPTVRSRAQIFRIQKEDNPQTEESEAFLLAESMAKAVPSAREYDLVSKTGTLTKDKELFRAVLKELALIFRDACALAAGGESQVTASQAAGYLAQRLTRKKLMALLEAVLEAQAMLERNVNQTLLAAWMCAKLK